MFTGYLADRDAVNCDAILGCPATTLTHLFLAATDQVGSQGTNLVRFDDFFISTAGYNSTIPVPPPSFQDGLRIVQAIHNVFDFVITWSAQVGQTYSVQMRTSLSSGNWVTVISDYPTGGATETTVSYAADVFNETAFFRITNP